MPGYDKNWLWRGGDTWYQRWQQIWYLQPEFVQIISWNDYGESHYIGPLDDRTFDAFKTGRAPFNYVNDMPHDGWRELLPFLIDTYKNGRAYVDEEKVVTWYRPSLTKDCSDGKTSGNTASQLQLEFDPAELSKDRVYFTALLQQDADVAVYFNGGIRVKTEWDFLPPGTEGFGGAGLYHGSAPVHHAGNLEVHIVRDTMTIFSVVGNMSISAGNCVDGMTNWNAWVGVNPGEGKVPVVWSAFSLEHLSCVAGST
ncbi:hypothetical protein BBP40_003263 [Aspergillus hancockii]|nr:hypothetical protein BBP40_003263 [Aspergillus hancockii]